MESILQKTSKIVACRFGQVENIAGREEHPGYLLLLTHSLTHYFETVPNSKRLQTKTETWLLKAFKIQIAQKKKCGEKVKLLILSNFTFFHNVFQKLFSSLWRKGLGRGMFVKG